MKNTDKYYRGSKRLTMKVEIKLAFPSNIGGGKISKEENIATINEILKKFCDEKELNFVSVSNIDSTCLNKSKLHLNRKVYVI